MNGIYAIEPQHVNVNNSSFLVTGYKITNSGLRLAEATVINALGTYTEVTELGTQVMLVEIIEKKRVDFDHHNRRLNAIKAKSIVK